MNETITTEINSIKKNKINQKKIFENEKPENRANWLKQWREAAINRRKFETPDNK